MLVKMEFVIAQWLMMSNVLARATAGNKKNKLTLSKNQQSKRPNIVIGTRSFMLIYCGFS
ncbi:hypothetical protein HUO_05945 [Lactobacillus helveticus]|nr:hypothetical protein HUO_05945 [Lactobacillus helveticus]